MEKIREAIREATKARFGIDIEPVITVPEPEFGDFATNVAMVIAKDVNDSPKNVAEKIINHITIQPSNHMNASVAGPGFINIRIRDEVIRADLSAFLAEPDTYGASKQYLDKVVVTEFSDPNPFKVLHIAHFYTSVVGDAISNLIEAAGGKVHRVNFGGDVGLHAAKAIWAVVQSLGGENPEKLADIPEAERTDWLAAKYVEGNLAYEKDGEEKSEIIDINKRLYQIVADGDHESNLAQIYWQTRQWSYDSFDAFYEKIGIKFEKYYPESAGAKIGIQTVLNHPEVYEKSDGAVVFKGEKYGLHTRVFINSDGLPTYETKDLGVDLLKMQDYHFDKQIIITGSEIIDYMRVLLKSIEQFAPEISNATEHFTHGMIKLPGAVKMSSRLGNFVKAVDLLDLVADYQEKEQGNRDEAVVLGAIKYAFLRNRLGPDLIFDPETSVSLTGNSGPYLQYSLARAKSILRKLSGASNTQGHPELVSGSNRETVAKGDLTTFDEYERALAMKLLEYPTIINEATTELAPHLVCTYLYELAQTFSRFYENCKVDGDPRQDLRARLVNLYSVVLSRGLTLLGIPTVEKM